MLKDIETALSVIRTYETGDSAYKITNRLRSLTKPVYTTEPWTIATGSKQTFRGTHGLWTLHRGPF
jgi:hypothetical protein